MRRLSALTLALLLAFPVGELRSAPADGTISGVVRLDGRPLAGVTVAFVELVTGDVVRATSKQDGTFKVPAPVGEYAVTTESVAGLTVGKAPVRVAVATGTPATAEIDLVAVPSAVGPDIAAPGAAPAGQAPTTTPPAPAAPPAPGAEGQTPPAPTGPVYAETTGKGAQIQFEPVTCFVAGEFPLLDASIEPIASVARARVYFRAAAGDAFFYVEMSQDRGRYFGKLPRPRVEASPIHYYLQSTTTEFDESQTREIEAIVVKDRSECGDRKVAAFGPEGPVTVFSASTGGSIASPVGFAALAASSIAVGVVTIIAVGAAAAGIVGGVVVGPGGGTPPPPLASPSAIPVPSPIPLPTPIPVTTFR